MIKVDLDCGLNIRDESKRRIGFLANLHCIAYQEKENLIGASLTLVQKAFKQFKAENFDPENEIEIFSAVGGDFNFDNVSPGDSNNQDHPIFEEYADECSEGPGADHDWAIGTEWRQLRIHDERVENAQKLREALIDDVERRKYIIDADIVEQTMDLMYCEPKRDPDGRLTATKSGGMRRIDRILVDTEDEVTGAAFVTALAQCTDHVPYSVTINSSD